MSNNRSNSRPPPLGYVGDEGDYDDTEEDRDMILSKEDFELLHVSYLFL